MSNLMILPGLFLETWANVTKNTCRGDNLSTCKNKKHFKQYPHEIMYKYNSRGFRDDEWPENLKDAIWCFGDSFTVGIGSPIEHTWVNILQKTLNRRCINVSMNGASNHWILRKIQEVQKEINPKDIIVHWSYITRNEKDDTTLSDEDRRSGLVMSWN